MNNPNEEGAVKRDLFLPISILVAAVIIGGSVVFSTLYHTSATAPTAAVPSGNAGGVGNVPVQAGQPVPAVQNLTSRDVVLGKSSAPITVVEYGDYQCPFCTRYFQQIQPQLVSQYVNTGKVKFVFRDFPFLDRGQATGESHLAGQAAECAKDQNKFWEFHNALYTAKAQDEAKGGGENDGFYNTTLFAKLAGQLGMDAATLTNCVTSGKYAQAVNQDYTDASAATVNSTPATFVNGVKVVDAGGNSVGANSQAIFAAIEAALKG